jgi:hypothetical protein
VLEVSNRAYDLYGERRSVPGHDAGIEKFVGDGGAYGFVKTSVLLRLGGRDPNPKAWR